MAADDATRPLVRPPRLRSEDGRPASRPRARRAGPALVGHDHRRAGEKEHHTGAQRPAAALAAIPVVVLIGLLGELVPAATITATAVVLVGTILAGLGEQRRTTAAQPHP